MSKWSSVFKRKDLWEQLVDRAGFTFFQTLGGTQILNYFTDFAGIKELLMISASAALASAITTLSFPGRVVKLETEHEKKIEEFTEKINGIESEVGFPLINDVNAEAIEDVSSKSVDDTAVLKEAVFSMLVEILEEATGPAKQGKHAKEEEE